MPFNEDDIPELYEQFYQDLRRLARSRLRTQERMTLLETTALVHESFLRLVNIGAVALPDRERFLAYAARVMRSVIVDSIRARQSAKRGGGQIVVTLEDGNEPPAPDNGDEVMRIEEALEVIEQVDPRSVRVVEMRYFAGMTDREIAAALGVTERTIRRDWEKAKLLLQSALA
jgi:RNA polymerase sigma factor (TIGR02999 family)